MATTTENNKFNTYYYDITLTLVTTEDKVSYDYSPFLMGVRIYCDFSNNVFPIMTISLTLDSEMYTRIRDNDCYFVFNCVTKVTNALVDSAVNLYTDTSWIKDEIFEIMDKNKINFTDNDLNDSNPTVTLELNMFSRRHLNLNKIVVNNNFIDCRLVDVISSVFRGTNFPMVIERPDNTEKFSQIIIPPLNLPRFILYLQDFYVPYNDTALLFFNYNDGMLINTSITNKTPVIDGDYNKIFLDIVSDNEDNAAFPYDCAYKNDENHYYIKIRDTSIRFTKYKKAKEEINGTENIILSRDENLNIVRNDVNDINDYDSVKKQLYFDAFTNPYLKDIYEDMDTSVQAEFNFNNLDIEIFKPNKRFIVPFLDDIYTMKLERLLFTFVKNNDNGFFGSTGSCMLKD